MVVVTFEEVRQLLQAKVVRVVAARLENVSDAMIIESFRTSDKLKEIQQFCHRKFGENIQFLEVQRIEDRFLIQLIDEVTKKLNRKES